MLINLANRIWNLKIRPGDKRVVYPFSKLCDTSELAILQNLVQRTRFAKRYEVQREKLQLGRLPGKFMKSFMKEPVQIVASDCKLYKKNDICQQDLSIHSATASMASPVYRNNAAHSMYQEWCFPDACGSQESRKERLPKKNSANIS